jgi:membrane-bound metal-dependent hydrolase YbcI (DUF457 family)
VQLTNSSLAPPPAFIWLKTKVQPAPRQSNHCWAAFFTNLPDILEPATSPNHRKKFHSLAFAAVLGTCLYQLNQWQTETELESLLKGASMLAVSAYLIHLALDFTTAKSLPLGG